MQQGIEPLAGAEDGRSCGQIWSLSADHIEHF